MPSRTCVRQGTVLIVQKGDGEGLRLQWDTKEDVAFANVSLTVSWLEAYHLAAAFSARSG